MRLLSTLCLSLLLGASGTAAMASSKASFAKKFKNADIHRLVSVPGMVDRSNSAYQMRQAGFASIGNAPTRVGDTPTNSASGEAYGWITGSDGGNWYFTQSIVSRDSVFSEYYTAHFHESSEITLFDNNHKQVGSFSVKVPEGWKHVQNITPYGPVTKKLFDKDGKSNEILVEFHDAFNGENKYLTRAYDVNTGEIKFEMEGTGLVFDASKGWNSYQRLIMTHESDSLYNIDVIAPPASGKDNWYVENTFSFNIDNKINYLQGSCFNCMNVDGTPYYVLAQYEKPYTDTDAGDGNLDITQNPDNFLVLKTLDKNYKQVDSLRVSINAPEGVPYRSAAFGLFGNNDLSKGYFSNNGKLNYVVELLDYTPSLDADLASFAVYDSEHGKLKDICDNVTSNQWALLNTIHGKSDQMWFLQTLGTGESAGQQIQLVDVPSCEKAGVLPQNIDGNNISSNFDRYPTSANAQGYQYVIALANAEGNEAGEVLAPIAWVNPDCTIDHVDRLNLGTKAELFTPLLNSTSLNPYLFNTDDDMEYVYLAKKRREDGTKLDNVLEVAKVDGTVLKSWRGDDTHSISQAGFPVMNELGKYQMFVVFSDTENNKYDMSFYDLPFTKFEEGGKGTVEDPYLISTTGDFQQMALEPTKSYKLVADIDMAKAAQWWAPIKSFTGSLDGDGHTVYNLGIKTTDGHVGLFGSLDINGVAKNLNFVNPTVDVTNTNQYIGVLAGETSYSTDSKAEGANVDNISVYGAKIAGEDAMVSAAGGLVGCANLYTNIANSSFQGEISLPNSENVGGIVGQTRTSSGVNACYANVNATAKSNLGGIVGIAGSVQDKCAFSNCEVRGKLTAENTVGGFIGDNYFNNISNVISHADIVATNKSTWNGYAAGGILGVMESDWSGKAAGSVKNCVFDGSIKAFENGEEVSNPATTHQIAGRTIADEDYAEGETPKTETRLSNNYTANNVGNTDAASVEGAFKAAKEMNKDFFAGLEYAYGSTLAEPWKEDGSKVPTLYFNNIAKALAVSADDVTVGTDDKGAVVVQVSVYGMENADLESDLEVSATGNATATLGEAHGNSIDLVIKGTKTGIGEVTVSFGEFSATINVTVLKNYVSGIENVEDAAALVIKAADAQISAEGADAIYVYSVNGKLVGKTSGAAFSTAGLTSGLYIVKATDKAGHKATAKFVIK